MTGNNVFVGTHFQEQKACMPLADEDGRPVELLNTDASQEAVAATKPESVVHLAARAIAPESVHKPRHRASINVMVTLNLLIVLKESSFRGQFRFVSCGDFYERFPPEELPIGEAHCSAREIPVPRFKVLPETLVRRWCLGEGESGGRPPLQPYRAGTRA